MPGRRIEPKTDHGVIVPIVTPLTAEGRLDEPALRRIIDFVIAGGVKGIFVLGSTGEGSHVPRNMRGRVIQLAVDYAQGRAGIYAGTADTVFADVVSAAGEYLRAGARAVVAQLPSFFPLSAREQFGYYTDLVEAIRGPVLLYDIPSPFRNEIDLGVIEHLRAFPNVIGIKDSTGDRDRLEALLDAYADDSAFCVLVGTISLASYGLLHGADGYVPSTANLEPALCARLFAAARTGDESLMASLQKEIDAVTDSYRGSRTMGESVARLKRLMHQRGLCGPAVCQPYQVDEDPLP